VASQSEALSAILRIDILNWAWSSSVKALRHPIHPALNLGAKDAKRPGQVSRASRFKETTLKTRRLKETRRKKNV